MFSVSELLCLSHMNLSMDVEYKAYAYCAQFRIGKVLLQLLSFILQKNVEEWRDTYFL